MLAVDTRENKAWTLVQHSNVQKVKRRFELLEELMADAAAPTGPDVELEGIGTSDSHFMASWILAR